MPRDEFGVPAHIPPEISTTIRHTCPAGLWHLKTAPLRPTCFLRYYIPPQYYPFLKKLGDDTPELKQLG